MKVETLRQTWTEHTKISIYWALVGAKKDKQILGSDFIDKAERELKETLDQHER